MDCSPVHPHADGLHHHLPRVCPFYAFVKPVQRLPAQPPRNSRSPGTSWTIWPFTTGSPASPTKRPFLNGLDTEILNSKRTGELQALLIIDIDDFKAYNDAYGFAVGDQVIQKVRFLSPGDLPGERFSRPDQR
jgi:hypothetical protein